MKRLLNIFPLLLLGVMPAFGQEVSQPDSSFWKDPLADPLLPFYLLLGVIILVTFLILIVAFYMLRVLNMFIERAAQQKAEKLGIPYTPPLSWWARLNRKLTNAVPVEKETDIILHHNYDGIQELDNHLPPWWKWLFYITILWSVIYLVVYHVTDTLPLMEQEYENQLAAVEKTRPVNVVSIDETNVEESSDAAILESGKQVYMTNCASCHKPDGGGDIGPNLTDKYWLHGGSVKDIFVTVRDGIPNTNMIPWKASLSPEKIRDVSNYVLNLTGTTPAKAKEPQGTLYESAPSSEGSVVADTVKVRASL